MIFCTIKIGSEMSAGETAEWGYRTAGTRRFPYYFDGFSPYRSQASRIIQREANRNTFSIPQGRHDVYRWGDRNRVPFLLKVFFKRHVVSTEIVNHNFQLLRNDYFESFKIPSFCPRTPIQEGDGSRLEVTFVSRGADGPNASSFSEQILASFCRTAYLFMMETFESKHGIRFQEGATWARSGSQLLAGEVKQWFKFLDEVADRYSGNREFDGFNRFSGRFHD